MNIKGGVRNNSPLFSQGVNMKVVIAGSREITNYELVRKKINEAIQEALLNVTMIISGGALGVDRLGEKWANENGIPIDLNIPDWENINVPGAVVKINKWGKPYNARAGHMRNAIMADKADYLIAIWDGKSSGTNNMIKEMEKRNKPYIVKKIRL